jgi:tetratricopeptide (TPR) repeat protein
VKPGTAHTSFSLRSVQAMLSLPAKVIARLVDAGFVSPRRGPRNAYLFSFQDVVVLRTAHRLHAARIAPQKILRALDALRAALPPDMPLTTLRISAVGGDVAVSEGDRQWEAESGQMLFEFDVAPAGPAIEFLDRPKSDTKEENPPTSAAQWLTRALALEPSDASAAEAAYRQAIAADADTLAAYVNLGALLCDAGRCHDAALLMFDAAGRFPDEPLLHFNLAIALEDQQRLDEALERYAISLALDPDLVDAHFNKARLHERLGQPHLAWRHYGAYRRAGRGT